MSKTILIVEDYDYIRNLMRLWVEMYGFRAVEASDGAEAVGCVEKECPDLVLMDIGLPLMDGITATKLIRNLDGGKDIPVIAVTAFGSHSEEALQAGCNKVIGKPIDFENVLQIICSYFQPYSSK